MYAEDDLLPLSALQHLVFCERQCALIHLEGIWAENRLTVEGDLLHRRVHEAAAESRGNVHLARGVHLRSLRLGLIGIADVIEFHRLTDEAAPGVALPGRRGRWRPFPVEYKRGRPKPDHCDHVQLCAQALCLEEMHGLALDRGAFFYAATRRRLEVALTPELRQETAALAVRLHELIAARQTPPPRREPKCENCSLLPQCLPGARTAPSAAAWFQQTIRDTLDHPNPAAAAAPRRETP